MEHVKIGELVRSKYLAVISYPSPSLEEARKRIEQMERLGIDYLVFEGRTRISGIGVLGIGTVSVVVKAAKDNSVYALKIRRTDSNRESMRKEFEITSLVNRLSIGPIVFSFTDDLILMELVEGLGLEESLGLLKGRGAKERLLTIIHSILNQCRKLDILGIDHGELSNLRKHVLISSRGPILLDFESASLERRPKNVTSAAQYLLIGSSISTRIRKILGINSLDGIKMRLKQYKEKLDDYSYSKLLEEIGIL